MFIWKWFRLSSPTGFGLPSHQVWMINWQFGFYGRALTLLVSQVSCIASWRIQFRPKKILRYFRSPSIKVQFENFVSRSCLLWERVKVLTRTKPVRRRMASFSRDWLRQRRRSWPRGSPSPWATSGSRWAGSGILWLSLNSGEKLTTDLKGFSPLICSMKGADTNQLG